MRRSRRKLESINSAIAACITNSWRYLLQRLLDKGAIAEASHSLLTHLRDGLLLRVPFTAPILQQATYCAEDDARFCLSACSCCKSKSASA